MSNYDNWLTTTPEDEENDRIDREDAARERIERKIDGIACSKPYPPLPIIGVCQVFSRSQMRASDFDYDPFNP